jgi:hypothetical protein
MRAALCISALVLGALSLPADTLQLRDGRIISGTYLGGGPDGIRFRPANNGQDRFFELGRVATIAFDHNNNGDSSSYNGNTYGNPYNNGYNSSTYAGSADRMRDQYGEPMPQQTPMPVAPPAPQSTYNTYNGAYNGSSVQSTGSYIPAGTTISVRTIDPIDSDATQIGNTYQVTLAQPVVVNGQTIAPVGATAVVQVMAVQGGNGIGGRGDISLQLVSFTGADGRTYNVNTSDAVVTGGPRGRQSAEVIGGGAALGAIIGGIAGGGPGAAIGAATGAAAGTGVQLMRGHHIRIQPETILAFNLQQNVAL